MEKALVWQEKPVVLLCKQVLHYRRTLRVSIEIFFERNLQKCTYKIRSFSSKIFANFDVFSTKFSFNKIKIFPFRIKKIVFLRIKNILKERSNMITNFEKVSNEFRKSERTFSFSFTFSLAERKP